LQSIKGFIYFSKKIEEKNEKHIEKLEKFHQNKEEFSLLGKYDNG
jgi:hypothetical protein